MFLINRLPTIVLHNKSPLNVLFKVQPIYSQLKVLECQCFPNLRPYNRHKLQFRSISCMFLGHSLNHKAYKCLDYSIAGLYISHDVLFHENIFLFATMSNNISSITYSINKVLHSASPPLSSFALSNEPTMHDITSNPEPVTTDTFIVLVEGEFSTNHSSSSVASSDYGPVSFPVVHPLASSAPDSASIQNVHPMVT